MGPKDSPNNLRIGIGYVAMLVTAAALFALVCWAGQGLEAPPPDGASPALGRSLEPSRHALRDVLRSMAIVILAARLCGLLALRIGQPPVIGEIVAGIVLGPSLLGRASPELQAWLLPPSVVPSIEIIAQVGIVLFMFLVGLELDTGLLATRTHATLAISHASIVVPMLLGGATAFFLYPIVSHAGVPFPLFALFLGVAMSVTAFPVLARILTDRGMSKTRLGVMAISCAAIDDVSAWCLLALLVSAARDRLLDAATTVGMTVLYVLFVVVLVRPLVRRLAARQEIRQRIGASDVAFALVALMLSALATETIGIHALFGAFLLGAVVPHDSLLARELTRSLEHIVVLFFLPAFFAFTGLRTRIDLVSGARLWLLCGLIVFVACAGKFGGSFVAARLVGLDRRSSACIGVLMNTRGLIELVVLNIGLDLGVISPTLFVMMVIMALATTLATTPALALLMRGAPEELTESAAATAR